MEKTDKKPVTKKTAKSEVEPEKTSAVMKSEKPVKETAVKPAARKVSRPNSKAEKSFVDGIIDGTNLGLPVYKVIRELNKDRLDSVAVETESRDYTYRQMFRMWDNYAEVFSALGITGKNKSRVSILNPNCMELVSAYFALNMVGTTVSLNETVLSDSFIDVIKKEKITDIITTDVSMTPILAESILESKEETGIRNIILIKNTIDRKKPTPIENFLIDRNYNGLRSMKGILFMNELLEEYETTPIAYADEKKDFYAAIFHTSGTTKGIRKPIPFTNRQLNAAASFVLKDKTFEKYVGRGRIAAEMDFSHGYSYTDVLMVSLFLGCTIVMGRYEWMSVSYGKYLKDKKINIMITTTLPLDMMSEFGGMYQPDLSQIETVIIGGTAVSADMKTRFNEFLEKCGSKAKVQVGYGLTEACGACLLCKEDDPVDESTGHPLPGYEIKILDENTGKYYDISDGERKGGLYIAGEAISSGMLDGEVFFKLTRIDGKSYVCTNDLVKVNPNGSITCCGRMNNFFTNNEGVRFDCGLVEDAISKESGIKACSIVAEYDKMIRDSVPILYVETEKGDDRLMTVKNALYNVFSKVEIYSKSNMPSQVIFVETMPRNTGGKINKYELSDTYVEIENRFNIVPVRKEETLNDVLLVPPLRNSAWMTVEPEELKKKKKDDFFSALKDPDAFNIVPPEGLMYIFTDFGKKVFEGLNKQEKGDKEKMDSNNSNNDNGWQMPFPPFPWMNNNGNNSNQNFQGFGQPPFSFPPFVQNNQNNQSNNNNGWQMPFWGMYNGQNNQNNTNQVPFWWNNQNNNQWNNMPPFPWMNGNNQNFQGFGPAPFPFPPFGMNTEDKKESEEKEENNEETPSFADFFKNMEKQELPKEEMVKILDWVQEVLGYFFKAEKIDYTFEED